VHSDVSKVGGKPATEPEDDAGPLDGAVGKGEPGAQPRRLGLGRVELRHQDAMRFHSWIHALLGAMDQVAYCCSSLPSDVARKGLLASILGAWGAAGKSTK
jgi:hypothetical protein